MTTEPTQTSDAELLAWIIASIAVEKGDIKGHDFHGNQWTGGIGSEKVAEIQSRLAKAADKLTKQAFAEEASRPDRADWRRNVLENHGYRSLEEYQKDAAQTVKEYVARNDIAVSVVTPEKNLLAIINSGEIQNGYVSGNSQRSYAYKLGTPDDFRMEVENEAFGLTNKSPLSERPVYGFVDSPGINDDPSFAYGEAKIVLNPDIKERSTVTIGDSLDTAEKGWTAKFNLTTAPLLASDPNPKDIFHPNVEGGDIVQLLTPSEPYYQKGGYVEAQIHGGLKTSDIARVDFYKEPTPEVEAALRDKGIPYRTNITD
jgi:hypothetical protein